MTTSIALDHLAAARAEFDQVTTYLNTATVGLPPRRSWDALQNMLAQWQSGQADPVAYGGAVEAARAAYAGLVGVPASWVATGYQVSPFAGLLAANLGDGSEVLTAQGDFTSILFPFHSQARRGVTVREVPLSDLADAVTPSTTLVSVSLVQSADGRLLDLPGLRSACAATGTRILLDVTQAAGWLPVDAATVDYTVCAGYKWLLAAKGTAYLSIAPHLMDELIPHGTGWYGGEEPWASIYGGPLRLAADARRFDTSPAWQSWVSAVPSLDLLTEVGPDRLHGHCVGLADRFLAGLGMPPAGSAIVALPVHGDVVGTLAREGITAATRAGRLRLSFHLANDDADVEQAVTALRPHLAG